MASLRSSFLRHVGQTSTQPDGLEVSRASGIYIFDKDDRAFIDCISGIAVSATGHSHPRIINAIKQQLDLHLHTHVYGEHIVTPQVRHASRLAQLLASSLNSIFFVNSGAEAVEGALKLAKKYTGRAEIVACKNAYHGSTHAGDSLRSDIMHTASSRPLLPGIKHIDFNSLEDLDHINEQTAAVIIEPIQGEAGVVVPSPGYLKAIRNRCNVTGTLLVFDEIQTGMGRTGSLWAYEHESVIPDILLLAKAFGGGLPLGAFIADKKIMDVLATDPPLGHLTTFGGNALCCTAGLEALNIVVEENLTHHAKIHEERIRSRLSHHHQVKEIRGRGLMLALELHDPPLLYKAITACREKGLLVDWFLFNDRAIRLAPPLIISETEMETVLDRLEEALSSL